MNLIIKLKVLKIKNAIAPIIVPCLLQFFLIQKLAKYDLSKKP